MKRLFVLFLLVVTMANVGIAQRISFGLKGGLNFSSLPELQTTPPTAGYIVSALAESHTGFHAGLTSYFKLAGFFLQPELLYTQTGRNMVLTPTGANPVATSFLQEYAHLTLPVQMGMSIGPLKVGVGPVFSMLLDNWNDLDDDINFDQVVNNTTLGYQVGVGIVLGSLMVDARFEDNLSRLGSGVNIGGQNIAFDTRPRQFILSLGFLF